MICCGFFLAVTGGAADFPGLLLGRLGSLAEASPLLPEDVGQDYSIS